MLSGPLYFVFSIVSLISGQERYQTEFTNIFEPKTATDYQPVYPLMKQDGIEETRAGANGFTIVKTEVLDSFADKETAIENETKERDDMSSLAIQGSTDVTYKTVQDQMLQSHNESSIIDSQLTKSPSTSKRQRKKNTPQKRKQTKHEKPESNIAFTEIHDSKINNMPIEENQDVKLDIEKLEANDKNSVSRNNDVDNTSNGTVGQTLDNNGTNHASLKIYKCEFCGKSYEIYGRLVRHRVTHSENGGKRKKYTHTCAKCGENFVQKRELAKHMTSHNRDDPTIYTCEICSKSYTRKQDLLFHNETVHSEDARISCEICGRNFSSARFLKIHTFKQTCTKLYTCGICGESFPRLNPLVRHRAKHTIKEYKCQTCGEIFQHESNLRRHKFQHSDTIFKCDFCDKVFSNPYSLKNHVVIHTKEKRHICAHCGESFGNSTSLRLHTMKHTGNLPYKCATCGKSFPTSSRLRGHSFVHGEIELHKCHLCKNVFRKEENLLKHILTHAEPNKESGDLGEDYENQIQEIKN